jgi:hypothetical protein
MKLNLPEIQVIAIALIFASAIFSACSVLPPSGMPTLTAFQTPDIPNWGSTPSNPKYAHNMPESLSCTLVPETIPKEGDVVWRGLKVGVSNYQDVKKTLATNGVSYLWDKVEGNFLFYTSQQPLWSAETCFVEGQLAAINVLAQEFIKPLPDILAEYGNPDRVIWANEYEDRSLLWPEKGLLIVVGVATNNEVRGGHAILFSPIPRCQLEQNWVYQSLPKEGQPITGDVVHNISGDEDPWKIEKGLADCPKK